MTEAVTAIARETIDRRIEIVIGVDEGLPDVLADPGQVEQVLLNLVLNARDAVIDQIERTADEYRPAIRIGAAQRRHEDREEPRCCRSRTAGRNWWSAWRPCGSRRRRPLPGS